MRASTKHRQQKFRHPCSVENLDEKPVGEQDKTHEFSPKHARTALFVTFVVVSRGYFKQRFDFGFLLTDQIFIKKGQNSQFVSNKINTKISKITFTQNLN